MSRSLRAWTESCALVVAAVCGIGRAGGWRPQVRLRRLGIARSLTLSLGLLTVALLSLMLVPASSLAQTRDGGHHARTFTITIQLAQVRLVQRDLIQAGYSPGPLDGVYGPRTRAGVIRFQAAQGLQVDGIAGPRTLATLTAATLTLYPGAGYGTGGSRAVQSLQRRLRRAGFTPGPVDGRYGPRTEAAVRRLQAANGLAVDGIAGPRTFSRLPATPTPTRRTPQHTKPYGGAKPNPGSKPSAGSEPGITGSHPNPVPTPHPVTPRPAPAPSLSTPAASGAQHHASPSTTFLVLLIAVSALVLVLLSGVGYRARGRRRPLTRTEPSSPIPVAIASTPNQPQPATPRQTQAVNDAMARPAPPITRETQPQAAASPSPVGPAVVGPPRRPIEESPSPSGHGTRSPARGTRGEPWRNGQPRNGQPRNGRSAFELGLRLARDGDLAGAERAFRQADQSGNARAACNLGVLLAGRGEHAEAAAAYRRAEQRGDEVASCNLGLLLEERGELTAAQAAFQRADEHGDAIGSFNLARLLEQQGDHRGAEQALHRAAEHGPPEIAELAQSALHGLAHVITQTTGGRNGR